MNNQKLKHKIPNTKNNKGITLIALIITIVVLLILAVVAIGAVQNDGIINYAKNAREEYGEAGENEKTTLQGYLDKIEDNLPVTMEQAMQPKMLTKKVNSDVTDRYGNKITVPAGFKIIADDTTGYNEETIDVTKGIVIEDAQGNQFVWVPVGNVYYSETEYKTITLGRYSNFTANDVGEYIPEQTAENYATATAINTYYTEDTEANHNSSNGNVIAKDLKGFIESATTKCGYYIGRYEAGKSNNSLVCKADQTLYNNVKQPQASSLSKNMYKDATTFTSDLVNSYAWDTAIIFIQTFGGCADYASKNFSTSFANTGMNSDKYCNIHDISGNAYEWSTETHSDTDSPCVLRGGDYGTSGDRPDYYTSTRQRYSATKSYNRLSFRPLLYVAL